MNLISTHIELYYYEGEAESPSTVAALPFSPALLHFVDSLPAMKDKDGCILSPEELREVELIAGVEIHKPGPEENCYVVVSGTYDWG